MFLPSYFSQSGSDFCIDQMWDNASEYFSLHWNRIQMRVHALEMVSPTKGAHFDNMQTRVTNGMQVRKWLQ